MREFYEKMRESDRTVVVHKNSVLLYPAHYHTNLEVLLLKKGSFEITLSGEKHILKDGDIAVIDSYEIHSYDVDMCRGEREYAVVIFPYEFLRRFNRNRKDMRFKNPIIKKTELCTSLYEIVEKYLQLPEQVSKCATELFFALLFEGAEFEKERRREDGVLMRKILSYINESYRKNVSRKTIAQALGYTESHISRVFNRYMSCGISEYINSLRIFAVEEGKRNEPKKSVSDLIYDAGFHSPKTYYRAKQMMDKK